MGYRCHCCAFTVATHLVKCLWCSMSARVNPDWTGVDWSRADCAIARDLGVTRKTVWWHRTHTLGMPGRAKVLGQYRCAPRSKKQQDQEREDRRGRGLGIQWDRVTDWGQPDEDICALVGCSKHALGEKRRRLKFDAIDALLCRHDAPAVIDDYDPRDPSAICNSMDLWIAAKAEWDKEDAELAAIGDDNVAYRRWCFVNGGEAEFPTPSIRRAYNAESLRLWFDFWCDI